MLSPIIIVSLVGFNKMKGGRILLLLVCSTVITLGVFAAGPPTCPADLGGKCSGSGEWEGEFFPGIPKIKYEGPSSKNPLAFKWYNAEEEILGKKMKDWMRFSIAFWHTFRGTGGDPFGAPTKYWPLGRRNQFFGYGQKGEIGVDRWCFHDRDIAPDGETLEESNRNLDEVVALAKELQGTKIRPFVGVQRNCLCILVTCMVGLQVLR
ncbi:hypothetical protein OIU74_025893 [Salix koriyanagi]|uniref:xylose isomerase n=1 Tax=Salix koriyanagi TaxID=2511006 RepID=A0A9Q0W4Z6_9ROSI|nr:hypothetical protein OIU74_025893 [Salix koriyanagi]